jgi:hypothetical protein
MTEAEWLACDDSRVMLRFLGGKISDRKTYLTAAAFLRRFWHLIPDERSRRAVEAMERYADGLASWHALRRAQGAARWAFQQLLREEQAKGVLHGSFYSGRLAVAYYAAGMDVATAARCPFPEQKVARHPWLALFSLGAAPARYASDPYDYSGEPPLLPRPRGIPPKNLFDVPTAVSKADAAAIAREASAQAELLRDLFGNPFRPIAIALAVLSWQDDTVVNLAQAIYDDRAFDRLPILADALEEAGCPEPILLAHLRESGPHVRGCHVIDALLGKS